MKRAMILILTGGLLFIASCSPSSPPSATVPADPFVGFFANPQTGALELKRGAGEEKYVGSLWADFGPFTFEGTRDGNIIRGTYRMGRQWDKIDIESTPQGLVLIEDGTRSAPLKRYESQEAFKKSFEGR